MYNASIKKNNSSFKSKEDMMFSEIDDEHSGKLLQTGNLYFSADKKWCYQIGVIDYLQTFNMNKKMEVWFKKYIK